MKNFFYVLLIISWYCLLPLNAQTVTELYCDGSQNYDKVNTMFIDDDNNVHLLGLTQREGTLYTTFSSDDTSFVSVDTVINEDARWVKMDSDGIIINEVFFGGVGNDAITHVEPIGGEDKVFIGGYFSDTLRLGDYQFVSPGLYDRDVFIAKADFDGNIEWAQQYSGTGDADLAALVSLSSERIVMGINYTDSLSFDTDTLSTENGNQFAIARYHLDTSSLDFFETTAGEGIAVITNMYDFTPEITFVTGYFTQTLSFVGSNILQTDNAIATFYGSFNNFENEGDFTAVNNIENEIVLDYRPFDSLSSWLLTNKRIVALNGADLNFISDGSVSPVSMFVTSSGNMMVYGNYTTNLSIGDKSVNAGAGNSNIFIAKLTINDATDSLAVNWLANIGGSEFDEIVALLHNDTDNNLYMAGNYAGFIDAGGLSCISVGSYNFDSFWGIFNTSVSVFTPELVAPSLATLEVYPNPNSGNFVVNIQQPNAVLSVFNTLGQLVIEKTYNQSGLVNVNLNGNISKGMYYVQLQEGSKLKKAKIVVQ